MQRFLAEGEALQQVAVMGLRAPDGTVAENVPLYRIYPARDLLTKSAKKRAGRFQTPTGSTKERKERQRQARKCGRRMPKKSTVGTQPNSIADLCRARRITQREIAEKKSHISPRDI